MCREPCGLPLRRAQQREGAKPLDIVWAPWGQLGNQALLSNKKGRNRFGFNNQKWEAALSSKDSVEERQVVMLCRSRWPNRDNEDLLFDKEPQVRLHVQETLRKKSGRQRRRRGPEPALCRLSAAQEELGPTFRGEHDILSNIVLMPRLEDRDGHHYPTNMTYMSRTLHLPTCPITTSQLDLLLPTSFTPATLNYSLFLDNPHTSKPTNEIIFPLPNKCNYIHPLRPRVDLQDPEWMPPPLWSSSDRLSLARRVLAKTSSFAGGKVVGDTGGRTVMENSARLGGRGWNRAQVLLQRTFSTILERLPRQHHFANSVPGRFRSRDFKCT